MSRAEVICSSAGRPFGLTQLDWVMPSRREAAFMASANFSIEPDTPSASTTEMSFADFTIIIFKALSTVTVVPVLNPIFEGDCATALGDTGSRVSRVRRLSFTALSARYIVISLVVEAGYHGSAACSACSTLPDSASTMRVASADAVRAPIKVLARSATPRASFRKNGVGK
jgi:hypothetical protein